jgi:hypothetical protein
MAMEPALQHWLEKIESSIATARGELSGKLDQANQQFNDHLKSDAVSFNTLEMGQKTIERTINQAERRKEESERRLREIKLAEVEAARRKEAEDKKTKDAEAAEARNKKLQIRIAIIGGVFALVAALAGTMFASIWTLLETKAARAERQRPQNEEPIKKSP